MKTFFIGLVFLVAACEAQLGNLEPSDSQIRDAYLATDDVLLGSDILGGELKLSEFKKIQCNPIKHALFHCTFYAKFGVDSSGAHMKIIDNIVGSQSGYFREATFFQNPEGRWICADVTNSPSRPSALQAVAPNDR